MGNDVVQEFQVVVPGDTENLRDAEFGKTVQEVVTDGVVGIAGGVSHEDDGTLSKPRPTGRHFAMVRAWQSKNPATSSSKPVPRRSWPQSPISRRCPSGPNLTRAQRSSRLETMGGPARSR